MYMSACWVFIFYFLSLSTPRPFLSFYFREGLPEWDAAQHIPRDPPLQPRHCGATVEEAGNWRLGALWLHGPTRCSQYVIIFSFSIELNLSTSVKLSLLWTADSNESQKVVNFVTLPEKWGSDNLGSFTLLPRGVQKRSSEHAYQQQVYEAGCGFQDLSNHGQGAVHILFISVSLFYLVFQSFFRGELYYFSVQQF